MIKARFILGLVLIGALSCAPSEEKKAQALEAEVMELHDSAMAKMGALYNSRVQLVYLKDSLRGADSVTLQKLSAGIADLTQADESMMQWMRAYQAPDLKKPETALPYLTTEKEKMEKVRVQIKESLENAKALSEQIKTP